MLVQQVVDSRMVAYQLALKARQGADRSREGAGRSRAARALQRVTVHGRARPPRRLRARRQPAAADDHEDVVMVRRIFRAMGTDVELLLDAEAGERAERAFDAAEAEFERLEQVLSRFRADSELSRLNRDGRIAAASPDLVARRRARARGARGDRRALRPDRPRRRRRGRLRPHLRRRCPGRSAPPPTERRLRRRRRPVDGRDDRARRRASRLDLGGIGKGYAVDRVADRLALAGPCLVNAGGDLAVRGGSWPVGVDGRRSRSSSRAAGSRPRAATAAAGAEAARSGTT